MIQANELRVGNWVLDEADNQAQVFNILTYSCKLLSKDKEWSECNMAHLLPIQLTPEILEKAGFEVRINDGLNHWHIGINEFTHDWLFDLKWLHGDDFPFYRNGGHRLKYVHYLQNLYFSLTGKELQINF
jgi:hypothetical protein